MKIKTLVQGIAGLGCLVGGAISAFGQNWSLASVPTNYHWKSVAVSADGSKLVAVATALTSPLTPGGIYISTNSGTSWAESLSGANLDCQAVASSADGRKVTVAMHGVGGTNWAPVYLSVDSGLTWTQTLSAWRFSQAIAASADGTRLAAACYYAFGAPIYLSTNSGVTWEQSGAPLMNWSGIASSADGTKLAATVMNGLIIVGGQPTNWSGLIYTSTDSGTTWRPADVPRTNWYSIASSADGTKLAAVVSGGAIYASSNSGGTWIKTSAPAKAWLGIASSADGRKLLASAAGWLYTSTDSGLTWKSNYVTPGTWSSSASSADGNLRLTASPSGSIAMSRSSAQPILHIGSFPGAAIVSWTVPSVNFVLQGSTTCEAGWTDVGTPPALNFTNLRYEVAIPPTNAAGFYRLEPR